MSNDNKKNAGIIAAVFAVTVGSVGVQKIPYSSVIEGEVSGFSGNCASDTFDFCRSNVNIFTSDGVVSIHSPDGFDVYNGSPVGFGANVRVQYRTNLADTIRELEFLELIAP